MEPTLTLQQVFRYCFFFLLLMIVLPSTAQQFTFANGWGQSTATAPDRGRTVCTDASGNVYIAGSFYINAATPIDFGGGGLTSAGSTDGFVAKFNSSGVHQWSIRFGSSISSEEAYSIATDGSYVYVTGAAGNMTVGTSATIYPSASSSIDGFVMKLDAATAAVSWVTRFGGTSTDEGQSLCLDGSGNIYVSGIFRTNNTTNTTATFGSFTRTVQGNTSSNTSDMFVAKLNSSGVFQWVSTGGNAGGMDNISGAGGASSICYVPSLAEVVVVGNNRSNGSATVTYSTSSPASTVSLTNANAVLNEDFVLLEVNASDGTFLSGFDVGGDNNEGGMGVTYDASTGDVFFSGYFYSPSITFPGTSAITNGSSAARANGFYGRYTPSTNTFTWVKEMVNTNDASAADDNARGIASNGVGGIYVTGNFAGTTAFPDAGVGISLTTGGSSDVFLAKVAASNGNAQWAKQGSGTSGFDIGYGVAFASSGASVWITGNYATTMTFSPLTGMTSQGGNEDVYLAKLADQPQVSSVSVPANGTYKTGDNLNFTVNWNTAVTVSTVSGTPSIAITIGASSKNATYVSGSGTTALVFRYTVASGDADNDGITVGSSITLNSGTITNTASSSVNALLTLNSIGSTTSVLVDGVAPTVSSINRQTPSTASTNATSLVYRVTFSESVSNVDIADFSLTATSTAAGTIASVSASSGTTIDVTVNTVTGDGTLRLDLKASGTGITDAAGNAISAGFTTGQTYTLDHTAPSVSSINRQTPATASTNATSLVYRVTFSESVSNVDISDFALTATSTAAGTIASVSASSGTTIDVTVNSVSGDGTMRLDLNASGTGIVDGVSNAISGGFTTGQTYTLDHTAPSVSSINRQTPSTASTNATSVVYRVTFNESVSNVDITDFSLTATLTAAGTIASVSASSGTTIDVTVNTVSGNGTLRLDLKASGTGITDAVSNAISGGYTSGQTYTIDNTAPSVSSVNRQTPSTASTNASSLVYRITFSESVSNVDISDFSLTATSTAAGTIASVSASSGTTIDVTVNSASGDGTLRLDLKASGTGITDAAGNAISGGYTSGQTYTLDHTAPSVSSINRQSPATASTNATSVVYRVTFSESVSNVDISDFSLTATGSAAGTIASVSASSGTTIDVTVNSVTGSGTLRLDLNASSTGIVDAQSNAISSGYTAGQTYTILSPGLWTGATSNDYSVASNWDDNAVPTGATNITIPTGAVRMPVLSASTAANNITLQNATTLSLNSQVFTVNGNITVAGTGKIIGSSTSTLNLLGTGSSTLSFDQASDGSSNALASLTINGTGAVNTLSNKLNIYTLFTLTAGNLNLNGNNVVLKSTSVANTAMVPALTGTITYGSGGKFSVERYIPLGKRSYRLLAPGVSGSSNGTAISTIYQNWQNGGTFTAGIGTHITGNGTNGTDATASAQPSMFTYTPGALTYNAVTSTSQANDTLSAISGYRIFIRGDRIASNITQANNTGNGTPNINMNTAITLSASGRLLSGTILFDKTKTTISGVDGWAWQKSNAPLTTGTGSEDSYSLLPNPYLAMVDWNGVVMNDLSTTYYVWDPNKNLRGGYESYNRSSGIGTSGTVNQYIQPGQSFFVQTTGANPSLTISETDKNTTGANLLNAFRTQTIMPRIDVTLVYSSRPTVTADNTIAIYDNSFNAGIGPEDSHKLDNPDDNIAIVRNNTQLTVEGRPVITSNDTVALRLYSLQTDTVYTISIKTENFSLPAGYAGYLEDKYTNTSTVLNMGGTVTKQFTKLADSATFYNRFHIVFRPGGSLPLEVTSVKAYEKGAGNVVEWRNMSESNVTGYTVDRSSDGARFNTVATVEAKANNATAVSYQWYDASPYSGMNYYRIRSIGASGTVKYSSVVRVNRSKIAAAMSVYPNPVRSGYLTVQMDGFDKGTYLLQVYSMTGQKTMTWNISHEGGSASETIGLQSLSKGAYRIEIIKGGLKLQQMIIID